MEVMDLDRYDIVVCFDNNAGDNKIVTVLRDRDYQQELIEAEEYFWNNLEEIPNQLPDFVSANNAKETIAKLRSLNVKVDDETADTKCANILERKRRIDELKSEISLLEKANEADKILILASIEDNELTEFKTHKVINKVTYSRRYDTKELSKHPEFDVYKKEVPSQSLKIWEKGA